MSTANSKANAALSFFNFIQGAHTSTQKIMLFVILALLPGIIVSAYFLGTKFVINLCACAFTAILVEAAILRLRQMDIRQVFDGSACVTGLLLGLALPPSLDISICILGVSFAIIFGKHLYGGLGQNIFNPAMVGYAALIISFPLAMSTWPLMDLNIDGLTAATPLDTLKFRGAQTINETWQPELGFSLLSGIGWQWINISFLLGGLPLFYFRIARWQAPLAMIATISILALMFYDSGSSQSLGSPLFHLLSGGTMLAAMFIVTDPVSAPETHIGLIIFGVGIGCITFIIRSIGAYPDGIAFAVLLMNALTPLIDKIRLARK